MNSKTIFDKAYMNFSNEISSTTSRGDAFTAYSGQGQVRFIGELSDAAKNKFYFLDAVNEIEAGKGVPQVVQRYRKYYPSSTTVSFDSSEPTTSQMSNFGTDLMGSVVITPVQAYKAAVVTGYAEHITDRNLVKEKMDELTNAFGELIDTYICNHLSASTIETTSDTAGAMTIYSGKKTSDAALTTADVFSIEDINRARTLLEDKYAYYWNAGVFTLSTGQKNAWDNESTSPIVCMVGPKQKEALLSSGQLLNASQYGNRMPISDGEIGRTLLGVIIIMSKNVKRVVAGGDAADGGSAPSINITRCVLMKGKNAYTFVWFKKPQFLPWADARYNQKGIALSAFYGGSVVYKDAIVRIDCAD
jgi:N4-gp56 family major capsid protein